MAGETKNRKSKIPVPGTVLVPGTGNRSSLVRGQSGGTIDVIVSLFRPGGIFIHECKIYIWRTIRQP